MCIQQLERMEMQRKEDFNLMRRENEESQKRMEQLINKALKYSSGEKY